MKSMTGDLNQRGFTLVELIVVMVIIAILVSIAIPIFLNQRKKAEDAAAKADASTLGAEIATYYVDGEAVPDVVLVSGHWRVDGVDAGAASPNVMLKSDVDAAASKTTWCVSVYNDEGLDTTLANGGASYSAEDGLQTGVDAAC